MRAAVSAGSGSNYRRWSGCSKIVTARSEFGFSTSTARAGFASELQRRTGSNRKTRINRSKPPKAPRASAGAHRLAPRRRGRYMFESVRLESASRLRLWSLRETVPAAMELRVYPNLRRSEDLKALRRGLGGARPVRQIGRGREFEKLREYVPGDGFDE